MRKRTHEYVRAIAVSHLSSRGSSFGRATRRGRAESRGKRVAERFVGMFSPWLGI